ncbi:hypothetical protein N0V86_009680 [Didymella sp. IMI 355093]|nr:hypothetical protein N0V86_009680 [Didymella sp. IMI 355093]
MTTEWDGDWDDEDSQDPSNERSSYRGRGRGQPGAGRGRAESGRPAVQRPEWLGKMHALDDARNTETYKAVNAWAKKWLQINDLGGYLGAHQVLMPVGLYTKEKLQWLNDNLTNSVDIDSRLQQAKKLRQWVDKQPCSSLFSWLPSFKKLELNQAHYNNEGHDAVLCTSTNQLFWFQGKPFILSKSETLDRSAALNVRVFWGSEKPILALLDTVCQLEKLEEERPLMISTVWHSNTERDETTKRPLRLIDMEPEQKKWLLNDLATFFDKNSLAYYRSNGNPYRRGYLLYGPPGTGKTSLAQAIASDYDLELFEIKLAKMTDSRLQSTFKSLPSRCVVLFEDIDAAGIGREDVVQAEKESKEKTKKATQTGGWGEPEETFENDPEGYSGFSVLDGPGAKEGRFVVLTTNPPKTLDKALTRKGRMDKILYMGYSCPGSAACTFRRMFGTDLTFRVPEAELERLAERFAKKIPKDMFTPCEIIDYCRSYRGRPREAIKKFRKFVEDRIEGKGDYLYDIKDDAPEGEVQKEDIEDKQVKVNRLIAALPPDEPYPESDGEDQAYSSLEETSKPPSPSAASGYSTPLKIAGSPSRSSSSSGENFAARPRLADELRANGEQDWMFEDGHYPPEWIYKDSMGL